MSVERYQDINISDNIFKNEYSARYINNQYSSAYNILDNNRQLNSKKFVAEVINTISDILYSLEEDYYSNTNDYFDNLTGDLQDVIDNYKYIGDWNNFTVYRKYNIVTYSDKYYMYINETPSSGSQLNNISFWLEFILNGEEGAFGIGVNFIGNWDSSVSYNALDGVLIIMEWVLIQ